MKLRRYSTHWTLRIGGQRGWRAYLMLWRPVRRPR